MAAAVAFETATRTAHRRDCSVYYNTICLSESTSTVYVVQGNKLLHHHCTACLVTVFVDKYAYNFRRFESFSEYDKDGGVTRVTCAPEC